MGVTAPAPRVKEITGSSSESIPILFAVLASFSPPISDANWAKTVLIDRNPGRNSQTYGIARELNTELDLIHEPSIGVVGNKGDSQCYIGVEEKVQTIHEKLRQRIGFGSQQLKMRLVQPEYTIATSDGIRNGTKEMRYSLIGREVTNDSLCEHFSASGLEGTIAVVACDKPPVGTLSAILEHNRPAIIMSDGSIRPGVDSVTKEPIDLITAYQLAGSDDEELKKYLSKKEISKILDLKHAARRTDYIFKKVFK